MILPKFRVREGGNLALGRLATVHQWLVASGIIEGPDGILLVENLRRDGRTDWSPPGGVVEVHDGEDLIDGLTREVAEETGIIVTEWFGPVWTVSVEAPDMGWHLEVEVHRAVAFAGELVIEDPDGIVVDARFVALDECAHHLRHTWAPIHEPFGAWLAERWVGTRPWSYYIEGADRASMTVTRR